MVMARMLPMMAVILSTASVVSRLFLHLSLLVVDSLSAQFGVRPSLGLRLGLGLSQSLDQLLLLLLWRTSVWRIEYEMFESANPARHKRVEHIRPHGLANERQ